MDRNREKVWVIGGLILGFLGLVLWTANYGLSLGVVFGVVMMVITVVLIRKKGL